MTRKAGIWLIGAQGGVATTVAVGLSALRQGTPPQGLVSTLPPFQHLSLLGWDELVLGGHEIRQTSFRDEAESLASVSRALDPRLVDACADDLHAADQRVRPGILWRPGAAIEKIATAGFARQPATATEAVKRIQDDLNEFRQANELDTCVVVNLASTESPVDASQFPDSWAELSASLDQTDCRLAASSLYAIATLDLGLPFINFTPSLGAGLPALEELARERNTCHAGCDGKTGETFLKSVLAPAFAQRHLEILSWVGHNIFGNMDGQVLDDPVNKQTKVASKDRLLGEILGYHPQTHISIEYIRSLGDWKTAWDHIHFSGFLGTPMILQFTWQGCDSILAAPLVLDLVRFADVARERGEKGTLGFLASFFKSPLGCTEHGFANQFQMLLDWAASRK